MLPNQPLPVSVEVTVSDIFEGVFKIEGHLRLSGDMLVFEYRTNNKKRNASSGKTFQIKLSEIQSFVLRGVFNLKIELRPKQQSDIEGLNWAKDGKIVFRLKQRNRKLSVDFVSLVHAGQVNAGNAESHPIPFKLPEINLGLTEVAGFIYQERELLVVEILQSPPTSG